MLHDRAIFRMLVTSRNKHVEVAASVCPTSLRSNQIASTVVPCLNSSDFWKSLVASRPHILVKSSFPPVN